MAGSKVKPEPFRAGFERSLTNAQRELLKAGRKNPIDGKRFRRYVIDKIDTFRRSAEWKAAHRQYVRRHLKGQKSYWEAVSALLVDVIWKTFWENALVAAAEKY